MTNQERIDLLHREHRLEKDQWVRLLASFTPEDAADPPKRENPILDNPGLVQPILEKRLQLITNIIKY